VIGQAPPLVEVEGLTCVVRRPDGSDLPILRGIGLTIEPGEHLAVTGRSGSGKTTLLSVLGLLASATSGAVRLFGHDVAGMNDRAKARLRLQRIGFVFQSYSLIPHLSAAENIALPLRYGPVVPRREQRRRVEHGLASMGLSGQGGKYPRHLSGGEQQRVAIARALVNEPDLVLADEPTGALDTETGGHVLEQLHRIPAERGCALVVVTHDPLVAQGARRRLILVDGRIAADTQPDLALPVVSG
jgi:ABC-type lipoprotein export system ATPase subunit